jgi:hypothetical protein
MQSFQSLKKLAKALFKKKTNFAGIVTNSVIKSYYPGFLVSNREHWELLILKLLGRDRKGDKVLEAKARQHESKYKILSTAGLVGYGNPEVFAGILTFKYTAKDRNSFFRGEIGYSIARKSWFYSVRNASRKYFQTQAEAINQFIQKYQQTIPQRLVA